LPVILFGLVGVHPGELFEGLGEGVVGAEEGVDRDGVAASGVGPGQSRRGGPRQRSTRSCRSGLARTISHLLCDD
jgi:hypothetical protein